MLQLMILLLFLSTQLSEPATVHKINE